MATDIIIHDKKDNVGVVVVEKITPKQDCSCWITVSYTHLTQPTSVPV